MNILSQRLEQFKEFIKENVAEEEQEMYEPKFSKIFSVEEISKIQNHFVLLILPELNKMYANMGALSIKKFNHL